jgi:hypothetical protein
VNETSLLLRLATGCVRQWARLYTLGMAESIRESRLAEIESDLWEHHRDGGDPLLVFGRLFRGMLDDFRWRIEHMANEPHPAQRALVLSLGVVIVFSTLWVGFTMGDRGAPHPPAAPDLVSRRITYPPPPPPPPPPCNPPGIGRAPLSPCTPVSAVPAK